MLKKENRKSAFQIIFLFILFAFSMEVYVGRCLPIERYDKWARSIPKGSFKQIGTSAKMAREWLWLNGRAVASATRGVHF